MEDAFTPRDLAATGGPQAVDRDLRGELQTLIAHSSMATLQLAIERLDEAGPSVTLSVPGADPRLAEAIFRYAHRCPKDSQELVEKIHKRHARLTERYGRAYELASRGKLTAAVRAFDEYFAEVPFENDPKAAADRARLLNALAARAPRRKCTRIVLGTVVSLLVVLPLLAIALTGYLTFTKAQRHMQAREWHDAAATADQIARLPSWLRVLIPWRSALERLGREARSRIEETEAELDRIKEDEAAGRIEEAARRCAQLRAEDSPDYRARVDAIVARLRGRVEERLATYTKEGKWGPLSRLLDALRPAPELVAEPKLLGEAEEALKQAADTQAQRLTEATRAWKQDDWKRVIELGLEAQKTDREPFFQATRELAQLAADATARTNEAQRLARRAETALTERKYRTATDEMKRYKELVPDDDPQLKTWQQRVAEAEAAQDKLAQELLDAQTSSPALVQEKKQRVLSGDPECHFPSTRKALDAVEVAWRTAWSKAAQATKDRDYLKALDSLAEASRVDEKAEGELQLPTLEEGEKAVKGTAAQVSERLLGLKKEIERAADDLKELRNKDKLDDAKRLAQAIVRLDPLNWAGRAHDASQAYVEIWLARDKGFVCIEGGSFSMGITGDKDPMLTRAFKDGVIKDISEVPDAVPRFEVALSRFFMAVRLVSQTEFCDFLNAAEPPQVAGMLDVGPDAGVLLQEGKYRPAQGKSELPITRVSWTGATEYCAWLQTRLKADLEKELGPEAERFRVTCRLPSEAEWECAAAWKSGRERTVAEKRLYPGFDKAADAPKDEQKAPRAVSERLDVSLTGCCDMSSNVRQWVSDWYGPYPREGQENYRGPDEGKERVLRGGSFEKGIGLSFRRWKEPPNAKLPDVGFRVAILLSQ